MKQKSNPAILVHAAMAIILSLSIYYFDKELARAVFLGSVVFNMYLRMLCLSFNKLKTLPSLRGANEVSDVAISSFNTGSPRRTQSVLLAMTSGISALRALIIAAILAILIMKFKLNLIGLAIAFLLYQVIFIAVGIYTDASHNRTALRSNS